MKNLLIALCVVGACLCSVPRSEAGPLGRILSAPARAARAIVAHRVERRRAGMLPRQRLARGVAYGFAGGCAGGSCR
jgi:hypothetical protein